MKEKAVNDHIRIFAAEHGFDLWRNNVGACQDATGRVIRYGLCNDSKKLNQNVKSSDLIGVTPVRVTPELVGHVVGLFTAIETKPSDWSFNPNDERAVAQKAFHDIVRKNNGLAGFATSVDDYRKIIGYV